MKTKNIKKLAEIIDNLWDEFDYNSSTPVKSLIKDLINDLTGIKYDEEGETNTKNNND